MREGNTNNRDLSRVGWGGLVSPLEKLRGATDNSGLCVGGNRPTPPHPLERRTDGR